MNRIDLVKESMEYLLKKIAEGNTSVADICAFHLGVISETMAMIYDTLEQMSRNLFLNVDDGR